MSLIVGEFVEDTHIGSLQILKEFKDAGVYCGVAVDKQAIGAAVAGDLNALDICLAVAVRAHLAHFKVVLIAHAFPRRDNGVSKGRSAGIAVCKVIW